MVVQTAKYSHNDPVYLSHTVEAYVMRKYHNNVSEATPPNNQSLDTTKSYRALT